MNRNFLLLFIINVLLMLPGPVINSQQKENADLDNDQCYKCHTENELLPEGISELDIHLQQGLSCAGCHGGDPTKSDESESMNPAKKFIGVPEIKDIPKLCGKCHSDIEIMRTYQPRIATDQVAQYYTSVHGKKLKGGDENVATCISCHTSHAILPAKDTRSSVYATNVPNTCNNCHGNSELMDKYGLESNQFEQFAESVHGNALLENHDVGAPSCNDCHGNHGATPPGVASISHVCGTCHVNNMNYFLGSKMSGVFEEMDFHACEQCHGNHLVKKTSDEMIGVGESSLCIECHSEGDEGYINAENIYNHLNNLNVLYDSATVIATDVKIKGMNDIDIEYKIKESKQSLIQARTLVHTFDSMKVKDKTDEGMAAVSEALTLANVEIEEYFTRRYGYGIATIIFLILAAALYFKIRGLGKK